MKIKILKKSDDEIEFEVTGRTPAFANALRRTMMVKVPVLAIEDVIFTANDSPLFDEVIAHRLGLIPLKFVPKTFNRRDECSCGGEGCINCQVVFVLDKTGPCTVYSGDLKSTNPEVKPLYDNIPITKLGENQKLKLEAVAIMGTGKEHAKWKAANAFYQYEGDKFKFTVETVSGLSPKDIVIQATEILESEAKELKKAL
ncbi:MAG TPA: DNA-directed RNA polymerase subunit D [Candidatus Aenigmarchaeota archaeon]|nr:DNA-directed RNA polymerase subunit D [Candidatus Aenigmarchaeota archaeon]